MPAGGERPGPWALLSATSQREGMKLYSPWPKRQKEGKTLLGRGRTHQSGRSAVCQVAGPWWAAQDRACWHPVLQSHTVPPFPQEGLPPPRGLFPALEAGGGLCCHARSRAADWRAPPSLLPLSRGLETGLPTHPGCPPDPGPVCGPQGCSLSVRTANGPPLGSVPLGLSLNISLPF